MKNGKLVFALVLSISMFAHAEVGAKEDGRSFGHENVCPDCPEESLLMEDSNKVEPWMFSSNYWGTLNVSDLQESDEVVNVENWMFSNEFWGTKELTEISEKESVIKIESWMIDNNFWGTINALDASESEALNLVEDWMGSSSFWSCGTTENGRITKEERSLAAEH